MSVTLRLATFASLLVGAFFATSACGDQYSDAVDALNPTHYYRLDETAIGTVTDTGSSPINGTHEGTGQAHDPNNPAQVGDFIGEAGVPGPDVTADGRSLDGFDANNRALFNNDSLAVNLGTGTNFGNTTMTLALWFKSPCDADNPGTVECQGPPSSSGGERIFTNNFDGTDTGGTSDLDDLGHLQVDFGWGANLIVSIDNRFSDPLKSNFQIPHRDGHPGPVGTDPTGLAVKDHNWHHLVVSRNGDDLNNVLLIVDGVEIVQDRWADSTDSWGITAPFDARIGTRTTAPHDHTFNGWIDEVAIWLGRQLTVAEAQALYLAAIGELAGDYNDDGVVNAADYTTWRDNLGDEVTLPGDVTPGTVTQDDYDVWVSNFGATVAAGAGQGSATPEPSALVLLLGAGLLAGCQRARRLR